MIRNVLATGLLVVAFAASAAGSVTNANRATEADDRADGYAVQAKALGDELAASPVCQSPSPVVGGYDLTELCRTADRVAASNQPEQVDVEQLAKAVAALVLADLPARIDAAVSEALRRNPPAVDPDVLAGIVTPIAQAIVTAYLAANPPAPGRAPTADEVSTATRVEVAAYFERHPPPAGEPGRPPTPEEIDAAVARWFESNPINACPGVWRGPYVDLTGTSYYKCEVP